MPTNRGRKTPQPLDLSPYAGHWIAIQNGSVILSERTREAVLSTIGGLKAFGKTQVRYVPHAGPVDPLELIQHLSPIFESLEPIFLVGGAVRDILLQKVTQDLDFAFAGDGIQAARKVADFLGGWFYPLDPVRKTGRVILPQPDGGRLHLDFAAFRGETLEADLESRDFTINALAINALESGESFDPLRGAQDIRTGVIRACSPTAIHDDPIRVLRAVRQAAELGFRIEPETREQIRRAIPELSHTSTERIRDEVLKILGGRRVAGSIRTLQHLGIQDEVFPELLPMQGVRQTFPHRQDVWEHTLSVLQQLEILLGSLGKGEGEEGVGSGNLTLGMINLSLGRYRLSIEDHLRENLVTDRQVRPLLFLAALYHDVGKPDTQTEDLDGSIRFIGHEKQGGILVDRMGARLRISARERHRIKTIVNHHMRPHHLVATGREPSRRAVYRFFRDSGSAGVDICLLALADVLAMFGPGVNPEQLKPHLGVIRILLESWWERRERDVEPPSILRGGDLLRIFGLEPGPEIGKLLEAVRESQATGEVSSRSEALALVRRLLAADSLEASQDRPSDISRDGKTED